MCSSDHCQAKSCLDQTIFGIFDAFILLKDTSAVRDELRLITLLGLPHLYLTSFIGPRWFETLLKKDIMHSA